MPLVARLVNGKPLRPTLFGIFTIAFDLLRHQRRDQSLKQLRDNWAIRDFDIVRLGTELGFSKYTLKRKQLAKVLNNECITHWTSP
jgi:hypothetical protein